MIAGSNRGGGASVTLFAKGAGADDAFEHGWSKPFKGGAIHAVSIQDIKEVAVVVVAGDRSVAAYRADNGEMIVDAQYSSNTGPVRAAAFGPGGVLAASATEDDNPVDKLFLYDVADWGDQVGKEDATIVSDKKYNLGVVTALAFARDPPRLAYGTEDGKVGLLDDPAASSGEVFPPQMPFGVADANKRLVIRALAVKDDGSGVTAVAIELDEEGKTATLVNTKAVELDETGDGPEAVDTTGQVFAAAYVAGAKPGAKPGLVLGGWEGGGFDPDTTAHRAASSSKSFDVATRAEVYARSSRRHVRDAAATTPWCGRDGAATTPWCGRDGAATAP